MRNEEITERLTTADLEGLQEELDYANYIINRPPFPYQTDTARHEVRKQDWRDYRDQVLAEIASRA